MIPELLSLEVRKNSQPVQEPRPSWKSARAAPPLGLPCFPGGRASCLCHAALSLLVKGPWWAGVVLGWSPCYTQRLSSKMFPRRPSVDGDSLATQLCGLCRWHEASECGWGKQ